MLIKSEDSLKNVFQVIKHELNRGVLDKKHPFRFLILSSQGIEGVESRYVVLRKVKEDLTLMVFTDYRTAKIQQIKTNPKVALLFYHPVKRIQVRIQAEVIVHFKNDVTEDFWQNVQGEGRKAYHSKLAPGKEIDNPNQGHDWHEDMRGQGYFCVLEIRPVEIEALQLNGLEHLRAKFDFLDGSWIGKWLVP